MAALMSQETTISLMSLLKMTPIRPVRTPSLRSSKRSGESSRRFPAAITLDPQVRRSPQRAPAAVGVQHRRHKGDTHNRPTSPIEPATVVHAPSTTLKTTNLEE